MRTKKIKSKQISKASEDFENTKWKNSVPTCPQCGNQEMNYYVSAQGVWKCSRAHLHGNPELSVSFFKTVA